MKKGKFISLLLFLLIFSAVTAYIVAGFIDNGGKTTNEVEEDYTEIEDQTPEDEDKTTNKESRSPLSGVEASKENLEKRPVAVMFDNHPRARWQAGLSQAEIVYEFPVENPYTRYIGIFLLNSPKSMGPIRSTRPYLVETIAAYDPIYVRCGGSEAGKAAVKRYDIADLDCLKDGKEFTRSSAKKAPNNLYISMEKVRDEQERLNYSDYRNYEGYDFNKKDTDISGIPAESINIKYNNTNDTKYEFDKSDRVYKRYKDGKLHIDELDKSNVVAKNIIIQEVSSKVLDDEGRREIDIIGSGNGMYITNGSAKDITWKKESADKKITYYDDDGEISFNEGVTWVQIVQSDTDVVIE